MKVIKINGSDLTLKDMVLVARHGYQAELTADAKKAIKKSRAFVDKIVAEKRVVYGITTGFGKFCDVSISEEDTKALQKNLIMSHSVGAGPHFEEDVVRAIMLLRANALSKGYSGIRLETVELLLGMLNKGVVPAIPEKGSLGASGDLAPLSHMVLPMLGLGEAYYKGTLMSGKEAMKKAGLTPTELISKEGLALINGTQVMTAVGGLAAYDASRLMKLCDISAALTAEALNGITDAYMAELHMIRPHPFQMQTAKTMLTLLKGSKRTSKQGELRVQDAYSLRCIPQIHGASKDAINYVLEKVAVEINAVTDNPIILADKELAISGGNFHGQPMAIAFDLLGIAVAELANVSERRVERLVNPQLNDLPAAFLTKDGGVNSGFMIAQYAAAAFVSENKVLAHPASVDSIPSSANQEDHVSMGTIAGRKARDIVYNVSRVFAIELVAAAQGIDLTEAYAGKKLGKGTQAAYDVIRKHITMVKEDRVLYYDFDKAYGLILNDEILNAVEAAVGVMK